MAEGLIRIATRKSPLALAQTGLTLRALAAAHPDLHCEVLQMTTTGDERLKWSLELTGGKGLFTSELERALCAGEADLAVHSAKDLPTEMADGLDLAGFLPRESVNDVLVVRAGCLEPRRIATGSPRRRAQLKRYFPEAEWTEIRGNVGTRLGKIVDGHADATLMALAGLKRLGITAWPGLVFKPLQIAQSVPAAGQGAIALQCRVGEAARFAAIVCAETGFAVELERYFLAAIGGGCHSASAAHYANGRLHVFHEEYGAHSVAIPAGESAHARRLVDAFLERLRS